MNKKKIVTVVALCAVIIAAIIYALNSVESLGWSGQSQVGNDGSGFKPDVESAATNSVAVTNTPATTAPELPPDGSSFK
jgi:hypothetical protein